LRSAAIVPFLMTKNPMAGASAAARANLPACNEIQRDIAAGEGAGLIDIYPLSGFPTVAQIPDGVRPPISCRLPIAVPAIASALAPRFHQPKQRLEKSHKLLGSGLLRRQAERLAPEAGQTHLVRHAPARVHPDGDQFVSGSLNYLGIVDLEIVQIGLAPGLANQSQ